MKIKILLTIVAAAMGLASSAFGQVKLPIVPPGASPGLLMAAPAPVFHLPAFREEQPQPEPSGWSGAFYMDFKTGQVSAIAVRRITAIDDLFGRANWDLSISAFTGLTMDSSTASITGVMVTAPLRLARNVSGHVGLGIPVLGGVPKSLGGELGIDIVFRT